MLRSVVVILIATGTGLLLIGWRSNACQETVWENKALRQDIKALELHVAVLEFDLNRLHHDRIDP